MARSSTDDIFEDRQDAIDALYESEEDERLTQLLEPIGVRSHPVTPLVDVPSDTVQHTIQRNQGHFRHGVAAAVISVLLIFGIGLGAGMYKRHLQSEADTAALVAENERIAAEAAEAQARAEEEAEQQRKLEESRAPRQVKFIVSAAGYDSRATRIPLVVNGIDFEGNEVQLEAFINYEGEGLSLAPGEYSASIPASPVLADGSMYSLPSTTYTLRIPDNDQDVFQVDQAIVLIPLASSDVTEDLVNKAYTWAVKDTQFSSVGESNVGAARKIIDDAKERKAAQERAAKLAETRGPLAQTFAESYFTNVSFPNSDDDSQVMVQTNWGAYVSQFVAPGSAAQTKVSSGTPAKYCFATRVSASNISGDTVTVDVKVILSSEIKNGWTRSVTDKKISCTFNSDNKITDFTVS